MYSILIIEDDDRVRGVMQEILQEDGFDVRLACDGVAGIAEIKKRIPDLILCDIQMPGMDGHSVFETLKLDTTYAIVPFIFVTAQDERADIRRAMSAGADDYLTKPFSPEELVAAIVGRLHRINLIRIGAKKSVFQDEYALLKQLVTPREMEILLLVGQGYISNEIAKRLNIHYNTVQVHRTNLMQKLDAPNSATLARWAIIGEYMLSTDQ
jgi:DNA-binding NarL/FixJ family response regulator